MLSVGVFGVSVDNVMRLRRLGPLCTARGLVLIDSDAWQSAKCWDPRTKLMTVPDDLLNER